jgi:hypothetical protein
MYVAYKLVCLLGKRVNNKFRGIRKPGIKSSDVFTCEDVYIASLNGRLSESTSYLPSRPRSTLWETFGGPPLRGGWRSRANVKYIRFSLSLRPCSELEW